MQEGLESGSLHILASLNKNDSPIDLEHYLKKALVELNIKFPELRTASIQLALYYASQIIEGKLDEIEGLKIILDRCLDKYNFITETK
jgi:hypothetical protein